MQQHPFGATGLATSALGLGAGQIGNAEQDEATVGRLLGVALDLGITLIDTARGYGLSEERIGRHLAHRRAEFVLSTKIGYGVDGFADWTGPCITAGIEAALQRLQTDHLDIVHLHSCPLDVLQNDEVIEALLKAKNAGKLRVAAYSGENAELAWAIASDHFGSIECSVNLFDQRSLLNDLPVAAAQGLGVIAKRPLGNAPWRYATQPHGDYAETYWLRAQTLAYDTAGMGWDELALRFTAFAPGVSSAIVGTTSLDNLKRNARLAEAGPLPADVVERLRARFQAVGAEWGGEI